MADYVSILAKAIDGLAENNATNRQLIYQKARGAIDRKLRAMEPLPPENAIAEQMAQLESAINQVEGEHQLAAAQAEPPAASEPSARLQETAAVVEPAPVATEFETVSIPGPNPPEGFFDDPILIDGIGEKTKSLLEGEGITGISQIAAMSDSQLASVAEKIGFPDFEKNQQWKEQASDMLAGKLPRSKTDQERLKKMQEEAAPEQQAEPAPLPADIPAEVPAPAAPEQVPAPATVAPATAVEPAAPSETASVEAPAPEAPAAQVGPEDRTEPDVSGPSSATPPAAPEELTNDERAIAEAIRALSSGDAARPADPVSTPASPAPEPEVKVSPPATAPSTDPFFDSPAPAPVTAPVPPQTPTPQSAGDAPPFVSELEGDPMAAEPGNYTPPGSVDLPKSGGGAGKAIGCVAILAILGGAGYAAWANKELVSDYANKGISAIQQLVGGNETQTGNDTEDTGQDSDNDSSVEEPDGGNDAGKDTSRLGSGDSDAGGNLSDKSDSEETASQSDDDAAADSETAPTSIIDNPIESPEQNATVEVEDAGDPATSTADQAGDENSGEDQAAAAPVTPAVINGEKAFLYEEALGSTGASRDEGGITWSLTKEAPEEGAPPEAVIRGVMDVPGRGLSLNIAIKRNVDPGLPASHLIELFFTAKSEFSGGNVDNVSRFVMKATEQARGESLVGVPARIDSGFFLIALNNLDQAQQTNMRLLENAEWIDIPVAYVTGRRALMTFEKGESGRKVFADALADWRNR